MKKIFSIIAAGLFGLPFVAVAGPYGNMMGWGGMMGGYGGFYFWRFLLGFGAIVWLIVGVLAIVWLWQKINKK